ncbi:MAG: dehydratase [Propionibacteriaceae bacterium]|jgi:acyl dehydratase|nr:dehydratase [Propionibacteriaceae bacterium]
MAQEALPWAGQPESLAGKALPGREVVFTRDQLVRYAGASLDFNPIHWSDTAAEELGLPGVIAHGMLTMGAALRVVTDWIGDPSRVTSYSVRFLKPVVVDPVKGAEVRFGAEVREVRGTTATISLTAEADGARVLSQASVEVRLD